jgi:hypothetical protein
MHASGEINTPFDINMRKTDWQKFFIVGLKGKKYEN